VEKLVFWLFFPTCALEGREMDDGGVIFCTSKFFWRLLLILVLQIEVDEIGFIKFC